MKKFRVGFLLDDLCPDVYVNELIDFVERESVFDSPVLITEYKQNRQRSIFRKIISKLKLGPKQFLHEIINLAATKLITGIERKNAKKQFPNYQSKMLLKKLDELNIVCVEGE